LKDGGDNGGGMDGGGGQPQQQPRGGGGFNGGGQGARPSTPKVDIPAGDSTAIVTAEGTWEYTIQSPQGGGGVLVIKKDGDAYSGTITNNRFNSTTELSSVSLNGNEISLSYEATGQGGNKMPFQIKAIIAGDALNGTVTVGQFGTFPMNAVRK